MNLGDKVRDIITGFTGIVIARSEFFNGCIRVSVQPQELGDKGKLQDTESFDVQQLELVQAGAVTPLRERQEAKTGQKPARTGGPQRGEEKLLRGQ